MADDRGGSSRLSGGNWMTDTDGSRPVGRGAIEAWLRRHADLVALAVVVVAFLLRLKDAVGTWLNADEALHFLIANQPDLAAAYQYSLTNAHPPLYYLVLHLWQRLGDGEVALRLLSVIAGAATVWIVYRWLAKYSPAWGLTTALLLAVLPSLVALTAEVRAYALLLLLAAASLLTFERAMAEGSTQRLVVSALLLYGAILTHYSAPFLVATLGAIGLLRIVLTRPERRFTLTWVAAQTGAAALLAVLFATHVSRLRGSGLEREVHTTWLRPYFFDGADDGLMHFVAGRTAGVLAYVFGSKIGAVIGLLLLSVGVILLLVGRLRDGGGDRAGRYLGLTIVAVFAVTCAGAVAGLFPYGNTRHVAFLALFALPAICLPLVWATRGRIWAGLLVAGVAAVGFSHLAHPPEWRISRGAQRRQLMTSAIDTLRHRLPAGAPVLVDYQTSLLLAYYLRDGGVGPFPVVRGEFGIVPVGTVRMLVWATWNFSADSLGAALKRLKDDRTLPAGQTLWVMDAGWGPRLKEGATTFGDNIALFTVEVPSPRSGV